MLFFAVLLYNDSLTKSRGFRYFWHPFFSMSLPKGVKRFCFTNIFSFITIKRLFYAPFLFAFHVVLTFFNEKFYFIIRYITLLYVLFVVFEKNPFFNYVWIFVVFIRLYQTTCGYFVFVLAFLSFCIDFTAKIRYSYIVHFNNKVVCSASFHVSVVYFIDKERLFVNQSCRKPKRARRVLTFACCLSLLLS